MTTNTLNIFLVIGVAVISSAYANNLIPSGRIIDGHRVDSLKRFPHHVTIYTSENEADVTSSSKSCSGSIISDQWILSSISCVGRAVRLEISFHRLFLKNAAESFSVSIDQSFVHLYPTEYDDLALVQLPVKLQFSNEIMPIDLATETEIAFGHLTVMPGFGDDSDRLTYGMFSTPNTSECSLLYKDNFYDEYLQMCTRGWNGDSEVPCDGNQGGGLVVGWPNTPKLVGVFSSPLQCVAKQPAIYTKVSEYLQWIRETASL